MIEFLGKLFTGEEADEISDFWGLLATTIYSLYPEEMMDVIKQAYDDDLIYPGMIDYLDFEKVLGLGKDECLGRLKSDIERDGFGSNFVHLPLVSTQSVGTRGKMGSAFIIVPKSRWAKLEPNPAGLF